VSGGHRWAIAVALMFVAECVLPSVGWAQCIGTSCTVTISLPVTDVIRLDLSTSTTALGTPVEADFAAGGLIAAASGPIATVKSNGPFTLSVKGNTGTFAYAGTAANPNKSSAELTWALATGAAPGVCTGIVSFGNNMSVAATLLSAGTGAPAIGVPAPSQRICFRTLWSFASAPPGTYTLVVNFTLSGP